MTRSLRTLIVLSILSFLSFDLHSQSKKLWIEDGDKAFSEHDYANAIRNYLRVLDDTSVMKVVVLPYEVQLVSQKFKNDSAKKHKVDTLKLAKLDSTAKNKNRGA